MSDVKELKNLENLEQLELEGLKIQKQLVNYLKDKFYKQDLKLEGKRENLNLDIYVIKYISQFITRYNLLIQKLTDIKTTAYSGFKAKLRIYFLE